MELGMLDDMDNLQKSHPDSLIFKLVKNNIGNITFLTILEAARKNDKLAVEIIEKAGVALGKKVAFLVNLLNPQVVVIGGGIEKAGQFIMEPLKKTVKDWAFDECTRTLKIISAQLAENAVPLGAASIVIQNMFAQR